MLGRSAPEKAELHEPAPEASIALRCSGMRPTAPWQPRPPGRRRTWRCASKAAATAPTCSAAPASAPAVVNRTTICPRCCCCCSPPPLLGPAAAAAAASPCPPGRPAPLLTTSTWTARDRPCREGRAAATNSCSSRLATAALEPTAGAGQVSRAEVLAPSLETAIVDAGGPSAGLSRAAASASDQLSIALRLLVGGLAGRSLPAGGGGRAGLQARLRAREGGALVRASRARRGEQCRGTAFFCHPLPLEPSASRDQLVYDQSCEQCTPGGAGRSALKRISAQQSQYNRYKASCCPHICSWAGRTSWGAREQISREQYSLPGNHGACRPRPSSPMPGASGASQVRSGVALKQMASGLGAFALVGQQPVIWGELRLGGVPGAAAAAPQCQS